MRLVVVVYTEVNAVKLNITFLCLFSEQFNGGKTRALKVRDSGGEDAPMESIQEIVLGLAMWRHLNEQTLKRRREY